jgi:urease alpha subunit
LADRTHAQRKERPSGYGVSFHLSYVLSKHWLPFLRGGWADAGDALYETAFSGGFTMLMALALIGAVTAHAQDYDVVLKGGRVMDPETSLDAVMNVGIKGGKIAAVTEDELSGKEIIDVKGLVVSPGFIDTHQHSLDIADGRLAAQDGTTTHMELEFGRSPVAEAYDIVKSAAATQSTTAFPPAGPWCGPRS